MKKPWTTTPSLRKKSTWKSKSNEYRAYAEQTLAMNRMRGMLEDEMTEKRQQKLKEMQLENKRLALEKKQREQKWREEQEHLNQKEITDPNFSWTVRDRRDLKLRQWNITSNGQVEHSIQFSYDD